MQYMKNAKSTLPLLLCVLLLVTETISFVIKPRAFQPRASQILSSNRARSINNINIEKSTQTSSQKLCFFRNDDIEGDGKNVNYNRQLRSVVATCIGALLSVPMPSLLHLPHPASANAAAYLKEPTDEFQAELKKTAAFEAGQKKIRAEWDGVIKKLMESTTSEEKEENIKALTAILERTQNIPEGVKKQPLVKMIRTLKFVDPGSRSKKQLPTWSKNTEIAYQAFILEFNKHLVPDNRPQKEAF